MAVPIAGWTHLLLYVGMFILLLYLGYLSPELTDKELGEKQQHMLVIMFLLVFAVFSLTRGVNLVAGYIGIHMIYNTAIHFNNIQIQHTTDAYIGIIGVQSVLKVAASVIVLKDIAGPLATIVGGFSNNILTIIISASIHKVLLIFGHRYAMSTLFPLGLVLLLIPVLRPAGSFLVAQAIVLWLILPVVIDSLYIPVGMFFGATSSPSINSLMSLNSLNSVTTLNQSLQSLSNSMLIWCSGFILSVVSCRGNTMDLPPPAGSDSRRGKCGLTYWCPWRWGCTEANQKACEICNTYSQNVIYFSEGPGFPLVKCSQRNDTGD